ncbi:MAG TPA: YceI family protein [Candidatus Methylomirabilis sp.]|nr:YceI family protein [Candidatus Methylomirabilis sp.]
MRGLREALLVLGLVVFLLGAAPPPPCPSPADVPGRLLRIVPAASSVRFEADAGFHDFEGEGAQVEGWILLPEREPEEVLACVAVAAASLQTGISLRDHLMRQNHLEVERHPYIRLAVRGARGVEEPAPGRLRAEVLGEFTLHGIPRERAIPVEVMRDGETLTVVGSFPVRLSEHGIPAPAFLFARMRDLVKVTVRLAAGPEEGRL